jgi:CheY-like chemotaxis protein
MSQPDRLRVLIVDDCPDSRATLGVLLGLWGHEAREAADGEAALATAACFRPEVVLLDLGLPRMNGYEVARRLRQLPGLSAANLIALTGYGDEPNRRCAEEAGFAAYLVKPFDLDLLERLLAGFAARPEA